MRVRMIIDSRAKVYPGEEHATTREGAMRLMPWAKVVKKVNNGWIGWESGQEFETWCGNGSSKQGGER